MNKTYLNIKNKRKEMGWSQVEFAKRLGYTDRSSIAKLETGKINITLVQLKEIASVFGVSPNDLIDWEDL